MQIWVDADACPAAIKEILFRVAERLNCLSPWWQTGCCGAAVTLSQIVHMDNLG